VKGFVDDKARAFLRIPLSASREGIRSDIVVWIDTAFTGGLAIPRKQVGELGLSKKSAAAAILADGSRVELETYACFLDWFGKTYATQVVASDAEYPLLGTIFLDAHRLEIDYKAKTVELT
jgi:clan AA aspartic protease